MLVVLEDFGREVVEMFFEEIYRVCNNIYYFSYLCFKLRYRLVIDFVICLFKKYEVKC